MTNNALQTWLAEHNEPLPAFDDFQSQILALLKKGKAPMSDIAEIIQLDPGLACALFQKVNSRLRKSRKTGVDTLQSATGLLGKHAVTNLVKKHKVLSETSRNPIVIQNFHQLLSKSFHALEQLDSFALLQGVQTVEDIRAAVVLRQLGEIYICVNDVSKYQLYQQRLHLDIEQDDHAQQVFGFEFDELGKQLCKAWSLPELVADSFTSGRKTSRKARLVQLAAQIASEAEVGWYHKRMLNAQKQCTDYLKLTTHDVQQQIYCNAIQAAQQSSINNVLPAAARLIMLPDVKKPAVAAKTEQVTETRAPAPLSDRLKALAQHASTNQSLVLNELLSGLHRDLHFSRVLLLLLTSDKTKIVARAGKGLAADSPFQRLQLEVTQLGLLKSLLQKPQALNINATSFQKYESMLPSKFKATSLCNQFVVMSIFIGNKPIGLVYCDRSSTETLIEEDSYAQFKTCVMTSSKVLTYLAKRQSRSAADQTGSGLPQTASNQ